VRDRATTTGPHPAEQANSSVRTRNGPFFSNFCMTGAHRRSGGTGADARLSSSSTPIRPPHGRDRGTAHHHANPRAEARPETAQIDAPPEHTEGHRDRVAVGHAGAEDAPRRPQGERADPEAKRVEPSPERSRGRFPPVRAVGPFPAALARGAEGRGRVPKVCREPCAGHEVLLARHAAHLPVGTGLSPWRGQHFGEEDSVPGRGATAGGQTLPPGSGR
jgi:hypothetical protein